MNLFLARRIAERLHAGQVDKAGQPYIEHCRRVVAHLIRMFPDATKSEIAAAWLHDVLEDCDVTGPELLDMGVSPEALRIIQAVTRPKDGSTYLEWIQRIADSGNVSAIKVKFADNADNCDLQRVTAYVEGEWLYRERYAPARKILRHALMVAG